MTDEKPRVIIIPPKPELQQTTTVTKQLRVAAYCRVSTKEEEQASSYEAQCQYYTDKIMSNKEWTMAGIFADEGITCTSTKKRTEFLRMIRQCKQKKIDLILTKSIQRFARNTLDCINYTRILRQLGIGVLFEKENINSLPPDSEFMITMYGAMAQSESESISGNIRRGRQMHAKVGTLKIPCYRLYGYEKDADGKFRVIPEQAEIVRELYKRYESGASLRNLQDWLEENQIKTVLGESKWTTTSIKSILTNEKYCGDVLLQKTFRTDVISKKVIRNVGQMTQYYMPDHHEGIVSREQYNAVKAEMARRSALRSPSKQAVTGRSCYTSKYALSDRLVCGECGTLYRRCTWTSRGRKYPVWRCTSRLNYGTKYCHDSPTIKEEPLQNAILAAINSAMSNKPALLDLIKNAVSLELLPVQGQTMSLADIERRLTQLDEQFQRLLAEAIDAEDKEACNTQFAGRARDRPLRRRDSGADQERRGNQATIGAVKMIYATGDLHGNSLRFQPQYFPEQAEMAKDDYMIVCGDAGLVWHGDKSDDPQLDRLEALPFTILFVDGNHENFDALSEYPVEQWHGGKVHKICLHVIHLTRGQAFELQGRMFFTMGGAQSHDIADGILDMESSDFYGQYDSLCRNRGQFRINHISWWEGELPSDEEYAEARQTLERLDWKVDYIITHCAPTAIQQKINADFKSDRLTDFLEEIRCRSQFHYWLFGHYHDNRIIDEKYVLLYEQMVRVL